MGVGVKLTAASKASNLNHVEGSLKVMRSGGMDQDVFETSSLWCFRHVLSIHALRNSNRTSHGQVVNCMQTATRKTESFSRKPYLSWYLQNRTDNFNSGYSGYSGKYIPERKWACDRFIIRGGGLKDHPLRSQVLFSGLHQHDFIST